MGITLPINGNSLLLRGPERVLTRLAAERAITNLGRAVTSFLQEHQIKASDVAGVHLSSQAPFVTAVPRLTKDLQGFERWLVVPRRAMGEDRFPKPVPFRPSVALRGRVPNENQQSLLAYRYGLGVENRRGRIKLGPKDAAHPHKFRQIADLWNRCLPTITQSVRAAEEVFRAGKETELQTMLSGLLSFEGGMLLSDLAAAFAPVRGEMAEGVFYNWLVFLAALYPADFGIFDLSKEFNRCSLTDMRSSSPYPWGRTPTDNVLMIRHPQNIADLYARVAQRRKRQQNISSDWFMAAVRDLRMGRLWCWVVWAQALELNGLKFVAPTPKKVERETRDTKYRIRKIIKEKGPITIKEIDKEYRRRFGKKGGLCSTSYWLYISKDREIICVGRNLYDWVGKPAYARYRRVKPRIPKVEKNGRRKKAIPTFNFVWAALHLHPEGLTPEEIYREVRALGGGFKKCAVIRILRDPALKKYFMPPTHGYALALT